MGKFLDRFGGMGRFKGGLRGKGDVCIYLCMYTISKLYQIININVSTSLIIIKWVHHL